MISVILIGLAAVCNACMDVTSYHFYESVFNFIQNKKIRQWFNTELSWKNKYVDGRVELGRKKWKGVQVPVQVTDSWHFCKMMMIVLVCLAIVSYEVMINPLIDIAILGTIWNLSFSLHYNYTFRV